MCVEVAHFVRRFRRSSKEEVQRHVTANFNGLKWALPSVMLLQYLADILFITNTMPGTSHLTKWYLGGVPLQPAQGNTMLGPLQLCMLWVWNLTLCFLSVCLVCLLFFSTGLRVTQHSLWRRWQPEGKAGGGCVSNFFHLPFALPLAYNFFSFLLFSWASAASRIHLYAYITTANGQ